MHLLKEEKTCTSVYKFQEIFSLTCNLFPVFNWLFGRYWHFKTFFSIGRMSLIITHNILYLLLQYFHFFFALDRGMFGLLIEGPWPQTILRKCKTSLIFFPVFSCIIPTFFTFPPVYSSFMPLNFMRISYYQTMYQECSVFVCIWKFRLTLVDFTPF